MDRNLLTETVPFCIRERQAAARYGLSKKWFGLRRKKGDGPPFIRTPSGTILYPLEACDAWFQALEVAR